MRISLVNRIYTEREIQSIIEVLRSGWVAMGPVTEKVETLLCKMSNMDRCILVSNATSALFMTLKLVIKPCDRVIVSPFTFASVISAIVLAGGIPVFVDIEKSTGNIDPNYLTPDIMKRSKAIIITHYAGIPTSKDVYEYAKEYNLFIIDDSSHAIGAERNGKMVFENYADAIIYSFNSTKIVSSGEGGAILTNNSDLAYHLKLMRNYGMTKTSFQKFKYGIGYDVLTLSLNFKFNDILASLLTDQLQRLNEILRKRRENAKIYSDLLSHSKDVELFKPRKDDKPTWLFYPILIPRELSSQKKNIIREMSEYGIEVGNHYPLVSSLSFMKHLKFENIKAIKVAREISQRILTLPSHEGLDANHINSVVNVLLGIIEKKRNNN